MNPRSLRRGFKNRLLKLSDAQVKIREATSNDPWGPTTSNLNDIANYTFNVVTFLEIMPILWKRLLDDGKNWRHAYKTLIVLDFLIKNGSEKVVKQCQERIYIIQSLKDFQYSENYKDFGFNIREKAKQITSLLNNEGKLKKERSNAYKLRKRLEKNDERNRKESSYRFANMEQVRPKNHQEERLQLKLSLDMSKLEADSKKLRVKRKEEDRISSGDSSSSSDIPEALRRKMNAANKHKCHMKRSFGERKKKLAPRVPIVKTRKEDIFEQRQRRTKGWTEFADTFDASEKTEEPQNDSWENSVSDSWTNQFNDPWRPQDPFLAIENAVKEPIKLQDAKEDCDEFDRIARRGWKPGTDAAPFNNKPKENNEALLKTFFGHQADLIDLNFSGNTACSADPFARRRNPFRPDSIQNCQMARNKGNDNNPFLQN